MELRYHQVRDHVRDLCYCPTGIMKADPWTIIGGKNDQGIFSQSKFFDCLTNLSDGMIDLLHCIAQ